MASPPECRICLGEDGPLIQTPCLCRGTALYVHQRCQDRCKPRGVCSHCGVRLVPRKRKGRSKSPFKVKDIAHHYGIHDPDGVYGEIRQILEETHKKIESRADAIYSQYFERNRQSQEKRRLKEAERAQRRERERAERARQWEEERAERDRHWAEGREERERRAREECITSLFLTIIVIIALSLPFLAPLVLTKLCENKLVTCKSH